MKAIPILLLAGGAIMMMGGKKKKKSDDDEGYEGEVSEMEQGIPTAAIQTMIGRCNNFINAVWTEPTAGQASIKSLVVEETIIPEMTAAARQKMKEKGEALSSDFSNALVMIGLNSIAPDCGWVLTGDGWSYANGHAFEGKVLDVYNSMKQIALEVIQSVNTPVAETLTLGGPPPPKPEEPGGLTFGS